MVPGAWYFGLNLSGESALIQVLKMSLSNINWEINRRIEKIIQDVLDCTFSHTHTKATKSWPAFVSFSKPFHILVLFLLLTTFKVFLFLFFKWDIKAIFYVSLLHRNSNNHRRRNKCVCSYCYVLLLFPGSFWTQHAKIFVVENLCDETADGKYKQILRFTDRLV